MLQDHQTDCRPLYAHQQQAKKGKKHIVEAVFLVSYLLDQSLLVLAPKLISLNLGCS